MRILIVRAGALGDVLLLRTTLHALRCAGHRVTLVTPSQPASLLTGEVEAVIPWEGRDVAGLLTTASAHSPAFAGHDLAVAFTRSAALVSALERFVPVRPRDPLPPAGVHAARWALEAVSDLVAPDRLLPPIVSTPESRARAQPLLAQLGAQFLAIHPGSGSPVKSWSRERYRTLADTITAPASERYLVVEGPADREAASTFDGHARAVFARDLDLPSLGAVLARARLLIGNDSGVAHLAAAFGAPCLVLFGPTDPGQWSPVGARVQTLRGATLETLSLEQVLAAAEPLASRSRWSCRELPSG